MENLQNGFLLEEETGVKTLLFEGEQDHLVPSTSRALLESDFFVIAGRIIGHCFLNDGPRLAGLSPAIVHVLSGGEQETAAISVSDCVDQDVRDVIHLVWEKIFMLEGTQELSEDQKSMVLSVSLPWDLPGVTLENRWWLREKILLHAVLGRTTKQVKQIKRGLKDTGVLELFSSRPDTVPILFPRVTETEITSQMILDKNIWPREEDVDEDILTLEDQCTCARLFPDVYRNRVFFRVL
ncbi:uncharacterized protein LOC118800956 isoform X2 [Colossoma macropomum]|uniref:uncharacterized protein LOC118800956 isoform X2 n=1 Tax=Colossoma macropomum TaxID=42526 RepID=UPI001863DECF|nr:uncharacterized protein LOC118800956 isoform X2 [Colossoma macropomum]